MSCKSISKKERQTPLNIFVLLSIDYLGVYIKRLFSFLISTVMPLLVINIKEEKQEEGSSNHWYYSDSSEKPKRIEKQKRRLQQISIKLGILAHFERHLMYIDNTKFSILTRKIEFCKLESLYSFN